jgi:predicted dehydrogenase
MDQGPSVSIGTDDNRKASLASCPRAANYASMSSSRRHFIASATAAAGALALPGCANTPAGRAARDPRQPARLMAIGVGGRGAENLAAVGIEDIRVLCDVDRALLAAAGKKFPKAQQIADYRQILQDPVACAELDGVVVSTPDHSHYWPSLLALQRGLDVYCEKPLTHTIAQGRRLLAAARENRCVTQLGIQIHAGSNYRRVVESIRAGVIGTVREVIVFVNSTDWSADKLPPISAPPADLSWDLWLGSASWRPFSTSYHPMGWRRYWAFGGGTTADMGCHFVDLAFWALELDAPISVMADGSEADAECAPAGLRCEYVFPARSNRAAITLRWHAGADRPERELADCGLADWRAGVLFLGDDGWLISNYTRHEIGPAERAAAWRRPGETTPASPGHHREWLLSCADRSEPSCSFAYGVPLTETVLLANVAFRAAQGKRLLWDAKAMRTDDPAADALLDVPMREGFGG